MPIPSEPNQINSLGTDVGRTVETWVSGGVLHSNTTICCDAINGTAPIRCQSGTLCVNLNAHMLGGATREDVCSIETLKKIQLCFRLLLTDGLLSQSEIDELTTYREILTADDHARSETIPAYAGIGAVSASQVREDRDPKLSTSDLVARNGGNVITAGGSSTPPSIDILVGNTP